MPHSRLGSAVPMSITLPHNYFRQTEREVTLWWSQLYFLFPREPTTSATTLIHLTLSDHGSTTFPLALTELHSTQILVFLF